MNKQREPSSPRPPVPDKDLLRHFALIRAAGIPLTDEVLTGYIAGGLLILSDTLQTPAAAQASILAAQVPVMLAELQAVRNQMSD